jgi:hypothetical protein
MNKAYYGRTRDGKLIMVDMDTKPEKEFEVNLREVSLWAVAIIGISCALWAFVVYIVPVIPLGQ